MSEEEKKAIELLKNKNTEYYYRFIDVRDAVSTLLNLIEKQQKEIEEKTTILLAGAEKVKELEKGNHSLMESRKKWKDRYYKEKTKNKKDNIQVVYGGRRFGTEGMVVKDYISKDKIKDMLNYLDNTSLNNYEIVMAFRKMMKELLEENDGDHIPRID